MNTSRIHKKTLKFSEYKLDSTLYKEKYIIKLHYTIYKTRANACLVLIQISPHELGEKVSELCEICPYTHSVHITKDHSYLPIRDFNAFILSHEKSCIHPKMHILLT